MSKGNQEYSIDHFIKNVRTQMNQISGFEDEFDTPLNQYLQDKYEKSKYSPYNTGGSFSGEYENSYSLTCNKEDPSRTQSKLDQSSSIPFNYNEKTEVNDPHMKIHSLESRISELLRIQDSLMKTLEENKISHLKNEQGEKRLILELKEKLAISVARATALEETMKSDNVDQMKRSIKELENSKNSLKQENSNLLQRIHGFGKDLRFIEVQSKNMSEELQFMKQQNMNLENEIMALKGERIENLKYIDELSNSLNSKDRAIAEQNTHILLQESRITDLKALIQCSSLMKMQDLSLKSNNIPDVSEKISQLTKENQDLKHEISQRPTLSQIHTAKKQIASLEKAVDTINLSSTLQKAPRSSSNEKKYSSASSTKIIRKLMQETNSENPYNLIQIFQKLSKANKQSVKLIEFAEKVKDLVIKSSPPQTYPTGPSTKKTWKWLKRLTEEYFKIKKLHEASEEATKLLIKLKSLLSASTDDEVVQILTKMLMESQFLKLLLHKTKVVLRVPNKLSMQELESELDTRL